MEHCGVMQGDQQQVGRANREGTLLALSGADMQDAGDDEVIGHQ